jgi:hypothetical protein
VPVATTLASSENLGRFDVFRMPNRQMLYVEARALAVGEPYKITKLAVFPEAQLRSLNKNKLTAITSFEWLRQESKSGGNDVNK